MTHYYLYIKAGSTIDHNTEFIRVAVGESQREQRLHAWIAAYAFEHGHFFARMDAETTEFYTRCRLSLDGNDRPLVAKSAQELKGYLQTGGEDPAFYQAEISRQKLLIQIDPEFYHTQVIKRQQLTRKNKSR